MGDQSRSGPRGISPTPSAEIRLQEDRGVELDGLQDQLHQVLGLLEEQRDPALASAGTGDLQQIVRDCLQTAISVSADLAASEKRYHSIFDFSFNGIAVHEVVTDQQGKPVDYTFTAVNRAFEELTGLAAAGIIGRRVTEVLPGIEREPFIEIYGRVALTGEPILFEQYAEALGKHFSIAAFSPRHRQFVTVFNDISHFKDTEQRLERLVSRRTAQLQRANQELRQEVSERRRVERSLKKLNAELERSNAELEQFAYVASHDLQEPLRMVSSYMQLLRKRYRDRLDEDADTFINFALEGSDRMTRMIEDLLRYSRFGRQPRPAEPTDSAEVLRQALANLDALLSSDGAEVTWDRLPVVWVAESELLQLFQNLLGNAIKFRGEQPPRVHVSAQRRERQWEFAVRDNGIGVAPEHRQRIFGVFRRLHSRDAYPGTGIGLAICKKIVDRHGGRILAEANPDGGTTFRFTLPADPGQRPG